jgi:hypothetical protein
MEVAIHGLRKRGGQCEAGWRRRSRPINIPMWYSESISAYNHTPPKMAVDAPKSVRGNKGRVESKMLPPPSLSVDGQIVCMIYCETSATMIFNNVLAQIEAIGGGGDRGVVSRRNRLGDHDHPIPC